MCKIKRKAIFFLPSTTGGAERMTINIAKMLPKDEYKVTFVIVHPTLGTIVDFIPQGYEVKHIPIRNIYCLTTIRMVSMLRKEHADIAFCSVDYLNVRLILAAKITHTKVVIRMNNTIAKNVKSLQWLIKKTYPLADRLIAQQEEMKQEVLDVTGVNSEKVFTLQNPIDKDLIDSKSNAESPYDTNSNTIKYVWVARFVPAKGQDLLVRAFEILLQKQPDSELFLVGKYDWSKQFDYQVKEYVHGHGLSSKIHFVGFDNNPYRWVKYADCYVMPSRLEGLPNSLIDAMYLGRPVVAARCIPVIDRIVENGYNGYVVSSENITELADAMEKAVKLHDFKMTYRSASKEDFINIFSKI